MPYRYLDDVATSDAAFEAWGRTLAEMFVAAAEATMNVMVGDLSTIDTQKHRSLSVESESLDLLLFDLLQELVYYKDAEQLLLRVPEVSIRQQNERFILNADAYGEVLDPQKHELIVDVKAVTLHRFAIEKTDQGWQATVILDI